VTLRSLEPRMHASNSTGVVTAASATGYMGVNLSGSQIRMVTDSGVFTAHCDYPMIEAVDVGSPARKADLRAGDTIVAYNNRDIVAYTINYPQLLVPGKPVKVRVKREGKARDVTVTVGERPQEIAENVVRWQPSPGGMITPAPVRGGTYWVGPGAAPAMAPMPRIVAGNASMIHMFGAQLNAVDEEFGSRLGLEPGILVLEVNKDSPAAAAGLRPGELILAVNGVPTRELVFLQRAVRASGARDVKLTVTAKDAPARIVTIRW
jgi:serine protease Do